MLIFILNLLVFKSYALEVIRPDYDHKKIYLEIIRVEPDSFETFRLTNSNLREMQLVCSKNRVYDNNPKPFLEYRNFYNIKAGRFALLSEKECQRLGRFIERAQFAVDRERPLRFVLDRKAMKVEKIIYPNIDPLADEGELEDLFPKKKLYLEEIEGFKLEAQKH